MAKKVVVLAVAIILAMMICSTNAWCAAEDFMKATQGYGAGAWYQSIYGSATDPNGGAISIRNDLGIKNATAFNFDANWEFSDKWGADVNFFWVNMKKNDNPVPVPFVFNNYVINGFVTTNANASDVTLRIRYNLTRGCDGRLDVFVAPKIISSDVTITQRPNLVAVPTTVFSKNQTSVVPVIGLSGKQRLAERLYIDGNVQGMGWNGSHIVDARADIRWNFQCPGWYATLGYRIYDSKIKSKGWNSTLNMNGPVATLRYEF